jgi:hypothetical protein
MINKINMDEHYKVDLYLNCGMNSFEQLNKLDKKNCDYKIIWKA